MSAVAQFFERGPFFIDGLQLTDGKLFHYQAGTSTLLNMWNDRAKTSVADQPILADANGMFFSFGDGLYKIVITDNDGATVRYTWDNVFVAEAPFQTATWTPEISFGGASVGVVYVEQVGSYTILGDLIFFQSRVTLQDLGSSTGSVKVTLPVTVSAKDPSGISPVHFIGFSSLSTQVIGQAIPGQSQMELLRPDTGNMTAVLNTDVDADLELRISGWYEAA